jgi:hypothetical protein
MAGHVTPDFLSGTAQWSGEFGNCTNVHVLIGESPRTPVRVPDERTPDFSKNDSAEGLKAAPSVALFQN